MIAARPWIFALLAACGATDAGSMEDRPAPGAAAPAAPAQAAPAPAAPREPRPTDDTLAGVIDQPAPPLQVSQWFNSPPLTLDQLRGKVVLVRWFTGPSCPFCGATAATLRALHERYAARGLVVLGLYHHKDDTPLDPAQVAGWVKHYGYRFPVAIDQDWTTLRRWWLQGRERSYTSVSFLLDKAGVVRRVHRGGTIEPEGAEIDAIRADVERLLAQ